MFRAGGPFPVRVGSGTARGGRRGVIWARFGSPAGSNRLHSGARGALFRRLFSYRFFSDFRCPRRGGQGAGSTSKGDVRRRAFIDILRICGNITMCLLTFLASGCPAPQEREISFGNLPLSEGIPSDISDGMTFRRGFTRKDVPEGQTGW